MHRLAFALAILFAGTMPDTEAAEGLAVIDRTPEFLEFYEAALGADGPDERFAIWKKHYDFVALPPGLTDRDARARAMLEAAWPDYPDVIDRIRGGAGSLGLDARKRLDAVMELLAADADPPAIRLLYYVGMLEGNAFAAPQPDGSVVIALPAESAPQDRSSSLVHELVHAVHQSMSDIGVGPSGSVAGLVLSEGLAMHATGLLLPTLPDADLLNGDPAWMRRCSREAGRILSGLRPHLHRTGAESVNRFTMGDGVTGMSREAYCAGWHITAELLKDGASLADLARTPEDRVVDLVDRAAASWLDASGTPASAGMLSPRGP
ncbi:MAG: hypothetical protein ACNS61_04205 [Candidatus Wenzhouxiangella sp. M2_3B_020]